MKHIQYLAQTLSPLVLAFHLVLYNFYINNIGTLKEEARKDMNGEEVSEEVEMRGVVNKRSLIV